MRPATSWLDRLRSPGIALTSTDSLANNASKNLGLASGPEAPDQERAVTPSAVLDFELQAVCNRLEAIWLLVHAIGERLGYFGKLTLRLLLLNSASKKGRSSSNEG